MSYGLQLAAAGALTSMYRMDVYANNLANMDSVGFKPDIPSAKERSPVTREDGVGYLPSDKLLERLGGGTLLNANRVAFAQGSLRTTGNPLDLAIQGEGFFVVRKETAASGDVVRLTRDGRFTRNAQGLLVTATGGLPVLDTAGKTITIPDGPAVTVRGDGTITQGNRAIATLHVAAVPDTARLSKDGNSLFTAPSDALQQLRAAGGSVAQNALEESTVDEIRTMMDLTNAARDIETNLGMIQQHDRMMDRAINTLGRVS